MHHHHPKIKNGSVASNIKGTQLQRRRKKRPNNRTRVVEVKRGYNLDFGFIISGQQPCRLSCIVANSPAEKAGLRPGDFLISVNGLNVSKLPHETVVQLIGNSFGSIRMQISENYFSDSSDEDNSLAAISIADGAYSSVKGLSSSLVGGNRTRARFFQQRAKMNRLKKSPQKKRLQPLQRTPQISSHRVSTMHADLNSPPPSTSMRPPLEELQMPSSTNKIAPTKTSNANTTTTKHDDTIAECNFASSFSSSVSADVANVSAMVRIVPKVALEYRAVIGYLGTIEMPKQIAHSSKLQTVRSCIRKLRQEKRQPTTVLMTILPDRLLLQSSNSNLLASYASSRLNYVSSSSESGNRFFGLVTCAVNKSEASDDIDGMSGDMSDIGNGSSNNTVSTVWNSCHVFVIDSKLCDHQIHLSRANEFRLQCTRDPISSFCLEFPRHAEYVVNLIRSMYTMRILPPASANVGCSVDVVGQKSVAAAHSPQPSNISEISTTSNSDSGIGFHKDGTNVSDRTLVVDFASGWPPDIKNHKSFTKNQRPLGIFNDFDPTIENRLTVRARPDLKSDFNPSPGRRRQVHSERSEELFANFDLIKGHCGEYSLSATRSCDDVLNLIEHHTQFNPDEKNSLFKTSISMPYKLRPQVFLTPKTQLATTTSMSTKLCLSASNENIYKSSKSTEAVLNARLFEFDDDNWSSLQNVYTKVKHEHQSSEIDLEATGSEPDWNRAFSLSNSAFQRAWSQSSFRSPRTEKRIVTVKDCNSPLVRRYASITASDYDIYKKSMNNYDDEFNHAQFQEHFKNDVAAKNNPQSSNNKKTNIHHDTESNSESTDIIPKSIATSIEDPSTVVSAWGNSFERLLEDPAGLHTFSEFLKKEFSAENIYFWTACERYTHTDNQSERVAQARLIFHKYLANGSLETVNVDSIARNLTEEQLRSGDRDIFAPAQKQIFNLMKFDSYQRFIRSDLYKRCQEAEEKKLPLPYSAEGLDELLRFNVHKQNQSPGAKLKLKKSASNAEDRRRKSLLPWHRKTRSKSRDRSEAETAAAAATRRLLQKQATSSKLPLLTPSSSHSLKVPSSLSHNSLTDICSSRSSLSSFDAVAAAANSVAQQSHIAEVVTHSLCRVILSDGATTIVQTRPEETVSQLVERLLEKRGLVYKNYDVLVVGGNSKTINLQSNALQTVAGKEIHIEQRVAFKLDLPDPKVISVKSKPKKILHEVIRPILHKYNYEMKAVKVFVRDTQTILDLSLPVSVVDGQRLQVVLLRQSKIEAKTSNSADCSAEKFIKPPVPLTKSESNGVSFRNGMQQSTLDKITNKVFNELLQAKAETHSPHENPNLQNHQSLASKINHICSIKSDESDTSSIIHHSHHRESKNIPAPRTCTNKISTGSRYPEEEQNNPNTAIVSSVSVDVKKPIIAKLKAGVKLQVTERLSENKDDLLEGIKRAQLARLEDQRGTEINNELPEFLKQKEYTGVSKTGSELRKARASLCSISTPSESPMISSSVFPLSNKTPPKSLSKPNDVSHPQAAPRFSIASRPNFNSLSPMKIDEEESAFISEFKNKNTAIQQSELLNIGSSKGPPPLPPKPKLLPIKPSNWGISACNNSVSSSTSANSNSKIPIDVNRILKSNFGQTATLSISPTTTEENAVSLEEPSSSFV